MKYFYFDPFKKQYFFPKDYEKYKVFQSFYQPYTLKGHLIWFIWRKLRFIRNLFCSELSEELVDISNLLNKKDSDFTIAYNKGTKGIENKITGIGIDKFNGNKFFIKYANTVIARANVLNEGNILNELKEECFAPNVLKLQDKDSYTLLKTTVFEGSRVVNVEEKRLLKILFNIGCKEVIASKKMESELEMCFAHGDFCPWNMNIHKDELSIFDWEMAGIYVLGYDLFTYIFQTNFLVKRNTKLNVILKNNNILIKNYFFHFDIVNWSKYLEEFAQLKFKTEKKKGNQDLISNYSRLLKYAKEL